MIIFTGTGRSGTGMYSKMFKTNHEYNVSNLLNLIQSYFPNWQDPDTDHISSPKIRKEIMKVHLENVDIDNFRDSSNPYIHFLDTLYEMDPCIRIVLGLRDGRDFARSGISRGYHTEKYHFFSMVPEHDSPYYREWQFMDPIEKMAWIWAYRNHKALMGLKSVPPTNYCIVRLEDIVSGGETGEKEIERLETFLELKMDRQWLTEKYNRNKSYSAPLKEEWTMEMNKKFFRIAGPLMCRFGYEF